MPLFTANPSNPGMSKEQFSIPTGFDNVLKDLNREILRDQPTDIIQYCATYFTAKLKEEKRPGISFVSLMPVEINMSEKEQDAVPAAEEEEYEAPSDLDSDSDDDLLEEPPVTAAAPSHNRNRRTSVSAESMAPASDASYVKVVIPKSEEQRTRIETSVRNNFLFKSLDEEQYVDVVDAMSEKKSDVGEDIIVQGGVGDFFYVAETGTFDVYVSRNGAPPAKVSLVHF
jgi:hypothetical protein